MKETFKGILYKFPPEEYIKTIMDKYKLTKEAIEEIFDEKKEVRFVEGIFYEAIEYKMKLNIFSFGKLKLNIPFTVVAMPISVDEPGYTGSLGMLVSDYMNKKGNTILLNLNYDLLYIGKEFAQGKTLPSLSLENQFASFQDYKEKLRSSYRRRVNQAIKKGESLEIKSIRPQDFSEELYNLYLQVLNKSKFPLETLSLEFFKKTNWNYDVFYLDNKPLAFVSYFQKEEALWKDEKIKTLAFTFGGMDYKYRDEYDLYYNMLLHIIKQGIKEKVDYINLGQTAEGVKQRLGAIPKDRKIIALSSNKLLNQILIKFAPHLENNKNLETIKALKIDQQN